MVEETCVCVCASVFQKILSGRFEGPTMETRPISRQDHFDFAEFMHLGSYLARFFFFFFSLSGVEYIFGSTPARLASPIKTLNSERVARSGSSKTTNHKVSLCQAPLTFPRAAVLKLHALP